ncbi:helix-turn-helix domain-containing protein [Peribacillus sp. SCS-155]|uniref:helix-turn-helix domain-containing protein n=1 Tax=Peribacillus sedimenti TaxID=3115297 RepID=UPI0039061E50
MDKEQLFNRLESMIMSSSKKPKYMSFSTVKVADILGLTPEVVEQGLQEMVEQGRIKRSKLDEPPHSLIYTLLQTKGQNQPSF